jgi:hypothetical protein
LRFTVGAAATSLADGESTGSNEARGVPVGVVLPALFEAVGRGRVVKSIEPHEIERRVPGLAAYSKENIHAAVALGGAGELFSNLTDVMDKLLGRMQGPFRSEGFASQRKAVIADLGNFLSLEKSLDPCPALILASSVHVSLESSPRLQGGTRQFELTASRELKNSPIHSFLSFPRPGLDLNIYDYKRRFEEVREGNDPSLMWVQRKFTSWDSENKLVQELVTEALGFAPDRYRDTLTSGYWHTRGRDKGSKNWTERTGENTLFTRNYEVDAWLFIAPDEAKQHVIGEHLHMALDPESGRLLDIDATERYVPPYLELNQMLRCAMEKAVFGTIQ